MKKKAETRKFNAEVLGMPPLSMALIDIPEPDPGKKDFRKDPLKANMIFQDSAIVNRLINYLKVKK